jgi:hypothetical protein
LAWIALLGSQARSGEAKQQREEGRSHNQIAGESISLRETVIASQQQCTTFWADLKIGCA